MKMLGEMGLSGGIEWAGEKKGGGYGEDFWEMQIDHHGQYHVF